jgi:probable F420-dependent oxidoreductase
MKVDGGLGLTPDIKKIAANAKAQEDAGYDGVWTAETAHDPFLPLVTAAANTERLELGTSIAVAFARNPMLLANTAWDLQALSQGRFHLGLGSQIKPHITKRFSMEWSKPAARMGEMVSAIRAIWNTWLTGEKLDFRGDFYQHTLMTPFFTPDKAELGDFGVPKIWLAGVGELMTQAAGEVCDGFIAHGFTTEKYLREVTIPNLIKGRQKAGKTLDGLMISGPFFVVSGQNEEEMKQAEAATKQQIAFYGSTPAYKGVLDAIGCGDLQGELNAMSKQGRWKEMGTLVTDDMLEAFGVMGEPKDVAPQMLARYGSLIDRTSASFPVSDDAQRDQIIQALRSG